MQRVRHALEDAIFAPRWAPIVARRPASTAGCPALSSAGGDDRTNPGAQGYYLQPIPFREWNPAPLTQRRGFAGVG